jgi:hypothetical protein
MAIVTMHPEFFLICRKFCKPFVIYAFECTNWFR